MPRIENTVSLKVTLPKLRGRRQYINGTLLHRGPDLFVIKDFPFCLIADHRTVLPNNISRDTHSALNSMEKDRLQAVSRFGTEGLHFALDGDLSSCT